MHIQPQPAFEESELYKKWMKRILGKLQRLPTAQSDIRGQIHKCLQILERTGSFPPCVNLRKLMCPPKEGKNDQSLLFEPLGFCFRMSLKMRSEPVFTCN